MAQSAVERTQYRFYEFQFRKTMTQQIGSILLSKPTFFRPRIMSKEPFFRAQSIIKGLFLFYLSHFWLLFKGTVRPFFRAHWGAKYSLGALLFGLSRGRSISSIFLSSGGSIYQWITLARSYPCYRVTEATQVFIFGLFYGHSFLHFYRQNLDIIFR